MMDWSVVVGTTSQIGVFFYELCLGNLDPRDFQKHITFFDNSLVFDGCSLAERKRVRRRG
jgi:hypothetical protein